MWASNEFSKFDTKLFFKSSFLCLPISYALLIGKWNHSTKWLNTCCGIRVSSLGYGSLQLIYWVCFPHFFHCPFHAFHHHFLFPSILILILPFISAHFPVSLSSFSEPHHYLLSCVYMKIFIPFPSSFSLLLFCCLPTCFSISHSLSSPVSSS